MKATELIMGMPVTIDIEDITDVKGKIFDKVFDFFRSVDEKYSPFKETSEVSAINRGEQNISQEMRTILALCEQTKKETKGYFDVYFNDKFNPSGLVKGWAIKKAADLIATKGYTRFFVEAGGDIQAHGKPWRVGIRNPFNKEQVVKILEIDDRGVATSGNYERGKHIYNPLTGERADAIASLSVIGPDIYEADRFATAAFAMGPQGIQFIETLPGFEGYAIDKQGMATMTSNFGKYVLVET
jgi:FAD:protein FMN transferase